MKKQFLAAMIVVFLVLGNAAGAAASVPAVSNKSAASNKPAVSNESAAPDKSAASNESAASEYQAKPQVRFSEWRKSDLVSSDAFDRDVTVSDGGNYLMTFRLIHKALQRYHFYYCIIYQGKGIQRVYASDLSDYEVQTGKLLRFETMEETPLDIDQVVTDHPRIQADDETSFILIFRWRGGSRDGLIDSVRIAFGSADLTAESYKEADHLELLGVLRFKDEDRRDLQFGSNIIQKDPPGYNVQMSYISEDYPDGIALLAYTNSKGTEVFVTQSVFNGYTVVTAYDPAREADDIKTGRFGIAGYAHDITEADFLE